MELFFVLIIGLCIGSFLNVCIYRIAREESIAFPPSHCTSCNYELKSKDLVPVLSYIFLGGKCRSCKEKISIKYPMIEILNALIYILVYMKYGLSYKTGIIFIFSSLLIVIALIDYQTKFVYSSTIYFGVIVAILYIVGKGIYFKSIPWDNLIGGAIGYGIIWLIVVITKSMGEGDIDISLLCGLFLGVRGVAVTLFLAIVLGGVIGAITLVLKLNDSKSEIAFGPYLAIGGILSAIWANELINIYMKIIL